MRTDVVATALETELIALFQGVPDKARGLITTDLSLLGGRTRRTEVFIVVTVPLIDFDHGLDFGVVVAQSVPMSVAEV